MNLMIIRRIVCNYSILYCILYSTLRRIAYIGTRGRGRPPKPLGGVGALEGTVTRVPANSFTININTTNRNTSIKADFSLKRLNLIKKLLDFIKISQNFLVFSKNIFKFKLINVKIFQHSLKIFPELLYTSIFFAKIF